jgi:HAD superfamily hydrolase (TIGR01509 family)
MTIEAIIFDFDGTIFDTETAGAAAWQQLYANYGQTLPMAEWVQNIGQTDVFHPAEHLIELTGISESPAALQDMRRQIRLDILAEQSIMPGVLDRIAEAKMLGLKLGIASSSTSRWLNYHLPRLGLLFEFEAVRSRSDVGDVGKPEPDVYLAACKGLRVNPENALALEDSFNGLLSAKRAGMMAVVIPNPVTKGMDFSQANLVIDSLADMTLTEMITLLS